MVDAVPVEGLKMLGFCLFFFLLLAKEFPSRGGLANTAIPVLNPVELLLSENLPTVWKGPKKGGRWRY